MGVFVLFPSVYFVMLKPKIPKRSISFPLPTLKFSLGMPEIYCFGGILLNSVMFVPITYSMNSADDLNKGC